MKITSISYAGTLGIMGEKLPDEGFLKAAPIVLIASLVIAIIIFILLMSFIVIRRKK